MRGYEFLSLDELERFDYEGSQLLPLRRRLGLRAFGANAWIADAGGQLVPPHEEDSGNEELYVVVRGRARFEVGGETLDAPAGTLVHVAAGTERTAVAEENGTIVLAAGATPGEAFVAHGWEDTVVAFAHGRAGRVAEGRAAMQELAARHPGHWGPSYNFACFEARFGDADAAFEHLRRAFELDAGQARGWAERDSDLDPLRDDPRFQELVG